MREDERDWIWCKVEDASLKVEEQTVSVEKARNDGVGDDATVYGELIAVSYVRS